jgi:thiol-disulfide isomerase/thioredoxin
MQTVLKYSFVVFLAIFAVSCSSNSSKKEKKNATNPGQQSSLQQHTSLAKNEPHSIAQYVENASFTSLKGKKISVSDFKGKVVLIDFWETWCQPCLASMPTLNKLQQEFPHRLKVLAVTPGFTDTKKDAQKFAKSHHYHFTYAMDTNGLHKKLRVTGIPYKVFVSAKGKFIKTAIGTHGPKADYKLVKGIVEKYSSPASSEKTG